MDSNKTNPNELNGRRFAVILLSQDEDGAIFAGAVRINQGRIYMDRGKLPPFEILPEWIDRIKPVSSEVKDILLDADFCLMLTVGCLPDGASTDDYIKTGIKWPTQV